MSTFGQRTYVAARPHSVPCCHCGLAIKVGDTVDQWVWTGDGHLARLKAHRPCEVLWATNAMNDDTFWPAHLMEEPEDRLAVLAGLAQMRDRSAVPV